MPVRNIKRYLVVAAAAAAAGLGATAPAAAPAGVAAAPASALAPASGGGAGQVPMHDFHVTRLTPAMSDDPHTVSGDAAPSAVLCATAIEYGLIAA
ncbi:MAG TPA: hypothetical protein VF256_12645 [Streptosporangiaceae bacterium]